MKTSLKTSARRSHTTLALTAATLLVLTLGGCGSGGGGSDPSLPTPSPDPTTPTPEPNPNPTPDPTTPTPPTNAATSALQGIWQSPAGASSSVSTVALPDGQLWSVVSSAGVTRLTKASLAAQASGFSGTGKSYTLGSNASGVANATATASVVEKSSLSGTLSIVGEQPEAFALAYQSRYDVLAALSDFAGNWQATLGPGIVNWAIASTGTLSGTRTTGCTYTGQLSLRAERKAVVDTTVTENCAGKLSLLQGVAVRSADTARISMVLITADESAGVAVNLTR